MTREQNRIARNFKYLEAIERKRNMPRPIVDPMGIPMGGNSQPQGAAINPVLQLLWPMFAQSIHDVLAGDPVRPALKIVDGTMHPAHTTKQVVDTAWEIANRAFERIGFQFVFPMAARIIAPAELHRSDREHAGAGEIAVIDKEDSTNAG